MHPRTRELLDYLDAQRAVLRDAFESTPPELRDRAPVPGRWSAASIIEHLAIVEHRLAGLFTKKIADARTEGLAPETATDPILPTLNLAVVLDRSTRIEAPSAIVPTGITAEAAWTALERAGQEVRGVLLSGDGLALGTLTHPHPLFGPLTLYHWFAFMGAHEARHAAQIRETPAGSATP